MKRIATTVFAFGLMAASFISCDPATLEGIMSGTGTTTTKVPLTNEEVIRGLKEALNVGAKNAVSFTSKEDGFNKNNLIRIPFPEEAQKVKNAAINLGLSSQVETFETTLNRAAEKAAAEAVPVFVNAITSMSIQDGFYILRGDSTAATTFLRNSTTAELKQKFSPIVQKAIDEVKLTSYWEPLTKAYNQSTIFTGNQPVNTDLNAYVTDKALSGLFYYVASEEKKIRKDPAARVTDILKRVFGNN